MNRYLVHYPRDFSNEYLIYAGPMEQLHQLKQIFGLRSENGSSEYITRKRAIQLGWSRPREARRNNEQWYGGFAGEDVFPSPTLEREIAQAVRATEQVIMEYENARDGWEAQQSSTGQRPVRGAP